MEPHPVAVEQNDEIFDRATRAGRQNMPPPRDRLCKDLDDWPRAGKLRAVETGSNGVFCLLAARIRCPY